jgi:hypothetical protein
VVRQVQAVYLKRALCAKRDGKAVVCSLVLPLMLVVLGLCIIKFTGDRGDDPSLQLSPSVFGSSPSFPVNSSQGGSVVAADVDSVLGLVQGVDVSQPTLDLSVATGELWGYEYTSGQPCEKVSEDHFDCANPDTDDIPGFIEATATEPNIVGLGSYLSRGWTQGALYSGMVISNLNLNASQGSYSLYVNTSSPHTTPIFMATVHDALARSVSSNQRTITAHNHPMPVTATTSAFLDSANSFTATIFILFSISFIPATFVTWVVREREPVRNAKHLQMLSGCEITSYWAANFMWDLTSYIPYYVMVIIRVAAFDIKPMLVDGGLGAVILLFF